MHPERSPHGLTLDRRAFLGAAGASLAAGAASGQVAVPAPSPVPPIPITPDWNAVRALFPIAHDPIDMSAMLITSHPAPVSAAIERHRRALDANPVTYLEDNNRSLQNASRQAIGIYLGVPHDQIALTDSTTMGVALVYQGLRLARGQELLTTDEGYYVTHESLRLAAERSGATVRRISIGDEAAWPTADEIAERVIGQIGPRTRVLALTWVHSSTGIKMPVRRIADALKAINASRGIQVLLAVDGVHGFGIEDETLGSLGCDFLMAGCHKWLFGPRGTGMIAATPEAWEAISPTIPTFLDSGAYSRWISGEPAERTTAAMVTPGGFKAFEHLWAISEAFTLHRMVGKPRIAARTHELASQLKEGLVGMQNVALKTPRDPGLSAGIVSFDVMGRSASDVVGLLRERRIIASVAPYRVQHVRLTPSVRNSLLEIDFVLGQVRAIAGAA